MGSFPALDVRPPATPPDPLAEFSRVAQIKGEMQSQQLQQQEIEIKKQQAQDLAATTAAMNEADPKSPTYFDDLPKLVLKHGGSANAATTMQQHGLAVQKSSLDLNDEQRKQYLESHKIIGDRLAILADPDQTPDDQLPGAASNAVNEFIQHKIVDPAQGQQYQQLIQQTSDPAQLRSGLSQIAKNMQGAATVAAQQKTKQETEEAKGKAREANATAALKEIEAKGLQGLTPEFVSQQVDNTFPPNDTASGGQNRLVKAQALGALQRGDVQGAKQILSDAFKSQLEEKKTIAVETDPNVQASKLELAKATKRAEQAISDGDPKAAAQLLVNGDVAPSQLISSRKPAFAQQAFTEAHNLDSNWNAQKAEADYSVAKSPQNLGFFGSAKSLTDPGGTLDQLKAAAKDIPEHQFPVFNSVDDWIKASTGSGPVAKYAALALGVADDYSKVMGGGQGSDTSRSQALNLIAAKESPEQKQASLEGIRGAVNSQKNSRIGNNGLLKKMYGDQPAAAPGGAFSWDSFPDHKPK